MSVDIFTQKQFEAQALPTHKTTGKVLWKSLGLVAGEQTYLITIDDKTGIEVRSSVNGTGTSARNGEDSIRAWLVDSNGNPLGSKVSKWTTRKVGWGDRTKNVLRVLWKWRKEAGNCTNCNEPKKIFKVKKEGPNKGKIFCNCENCNGQFKWISE